MDESEGREVRQLSLMQGTLDDFSRGNISIDAAVGTLKSLLWEIEDVDEEWRIEFHREWLKLEIEYASALSNKSPLPNATLPVLQEAVSQMSTMVITQLSRHSAS